MQKKEAVLRAAIDIGSNSTHLVVARCLPEGLNIVLDEVKMIATGASVDETGELSEKVRSELRDTVRHYQGLARQQGAKDILVVATEALREARNGEAILEELQRETGLQIQRISGRIEAALTFYGATYEAGTPEDVGVLDVGGGSTEIILARQKRIAWLSSVPLGSRKVHDTYLPSDPPAYGEWEEARKGLKAELEKISTPFVPPALIVTGSSAPALLKLVKEAFRRDEQSQTLTREDLLRCEGLLAALSARSIAQRYHQSMERARVLPGGALILQALMEHFACDEITVSEHGVREGLLLAYTRYGEGWYEQPEIKGEVAEQPGSPEETFAETGKELLRKRTRKFLGWRKEVLKHEDSKAVHKMRVASRRLRAVLDAYEQVCKPRQFKKVYRRVKKVADLLGTVRDTDVMLQHMGERTEQAATEEQVGIQWLVQCLEAYRQEQQQELDDYLQDLREKDFERQVTACMRKGGKNNG